MQEDSAGNEYINLTTFGPMSVEKTLSSHQPANIMGLQLQAKLGLLVEECGPRFLNLPPDFKHF